MNKKLLAVAVAGVLAAPTAALAQSSVTISGLFKVSVGNYKIANTAATRTGNTSQSWMTDDSSRIVFNVVEDLGGGLSAIGQVDWRIGLDNGTDGAAGGGPSGNTHVGLNSKQWGQIRIGRQDLHYFNTESNMPGKADLKSASFTVLGSMANGVAIANNSRTPNVVWYRTPNWNGFDVIAAYSFQPTAAQESDIGAVARKGRGWNIQPNFRGKNFQIGYSYLSAKPDATTTTTATCPAASVVSVTAVAINGVGGTPTAACAAGAAVTAVATAAVTQRGDRLYGSYDWGGFHIGLAWDKSKLTTLAGVETNRRTAWSLPIEYTTGPHNIYFHYTKARDDKDTAAQDGARMVAIAYAYDLSKRTSIATTYMSLRNDVGAAYQLFGVGAGSIGVGVTIPGVAGSGGGGTGSNALAGEDPRLWSVTLRHVF